MSIIVNISGKIFKVSQETIRRSQLFDTMMTDCDISGEIFIERSAQLFKHVYAFLLDPKYPYPKKYYSELDYYLVSYDYELLYDPDTKILEIKKDIEQIKEYVKELKNDAELGDNVCKAMYCPERCLRGKIYCAFHQ
jgi:hypothetical protein